MPTTGRTTYLHYCKSDQLIVHREDKSQQRHAMDELDRLSTLDLDGRPVGDITRIDVGLPSELLRRRLTFIDTPGANDTLEQSETATIAAAQADVILWVLRADALLPQHERDLVDDWIEQCPCLTLVPIVNGMNFVSKAEQPEVRRRLASWLDANHHDRCGWIREAVGKSFFEIDARQAFDHAVTGTGDAPSDFRKLYDWLVSLTREDRLALQKQSRNSRVRSAITESLVQTRGALQMLQEEADAAASAHAESNRSAKVRLQEFRTQREKTTGTVDRLLREAQKDTRSQLLGQLRDAPSSSIVCRRVHRWTSYSLDALAQQVAGDSSSLLSNLARASSVSRANLKIRATQLPTEFHIDLPEPGLLDILRNVIAGGPTANFAAEVIRRTLRRVGSVGCRARRQRKESGHDETNAYRKACAPQQRSRARGRAWRLERRSFGRAG